jgi:hypothetical protein
MKKVERIARDFLKILKENMLNVRWQINNFLVSTRSIKYFRSWRNLYFFEQEDHKRLIKLDSFGEFLKLRFFQVNLSLPIDF